MKKYIVSIEKTEKSSKTFEVSANSPQEAECIAFDMAEGLFIDAWDFKNVDYDLEDIYKLESDGCGHDQNEQY